MQIDPSSDLRLPTGVIFQSRLRTSQYIYITISKRNLLINSVFNETDPDMFSRF